MRSMAVACLMVLTSMTSAAEARPRVTLKLSSGMDAGEPVAYSYTAKGLPRGTQLRVVESIDKSTPNRSRFVDRTIRRLPARRRGDGVLPGLRRGRHSFSIVARRPGRGSAQHRDIAVGYAETHVFSEVPLADLLFRSEREIGVAASAVGPFAYQLVATPAMAAPRPFFQLQGVRCSALHLDFFSDTGTPQLLIGVVRPGGEYRPDQQLRVDLSSTPGSWDVQLGRSAGLSAFLFGRPADRALLTGTARCAETVADSERRTG